jgi:DNA polymerase-3 subunit alpha
MSTENPVINANEFYCHLSLQSDYSLLESCIQFKKLAKYLKKINYDTVSLVDTNSLFGAISFQSIMQENGIKPIVGLKINVRYQGLDGYLLLYAKNKEGYKNISYISSLTYLNKADNDKLYFPLEDLEKYKDGVICITGGLGSILETVYSNKLSIIDDLVNELLKVYKDNLYIEIEYQGLDYQDRLNEFYTDFTKLFKIPLVATNNCRFMHPDQYEAHDAMLALKSEATVRTIKRERVTVNHYIKTKEEMLDNFKNKSYFSEELFKNTKVIADKCNFIFKKEKNYMPVFPLPDGFTDEKQYFIHQVKEGWNNRIKHILIDKQSKGKLKYGFDVYKKRLQEEIDIISKMGFCGYFLVVADYINWAKNNGIPVGIGRGCNHMKNRILTTDGFFKEIKDINIGDQVFNKNGEIVKVKNKFKYECKEDLVQIRSYYGDEDAVILTKDHKVLVEKHKRVKGYENWSESTKNKRKSFIDPVGDLEWIRADEVEINDWVFTPFINNPSIDFIKEIDLSIYCNQENIIFNGNSIDEYQLNPSAKNKKLLFSINITKINLDRNFCRILGYFAGNGCFHKNAKNVIDISFNSSHLEKIKEVYSYFILLGVKVSIKENQKKNVTNIYIRSKVFRKFFSDLFDKYDFSSVTKHVPKIIMDGSVEQIEGFLEGFCKTDGCFSGSKLTLFTSSLQLAYQLRHIILKLGLPSSIVEDRRIDLREEFKNRKVSYRITLPSCSRFGIPDNKANYYYKKIDSGILTKIKSINNYNEDYGGYVYDIEIEGEEKNYLTSSFLIHNSVGGSLIAYCLGIINIDAVQYELYFERFINIERVALPDIDTDFESTERDRVIKYVIEKYGIENVSKIITFGTMAAKAAVKDVGRVNDVFYKDMESVCKKMLEPVRGVNPSIKESIEKQEELKNVIKSDPQMQKVFNQAQVLEDCCRNTGIHAAGIIICPEKIIDIAPLYKHPDKGEIATQFEMGDCENVGLVKMDFLGLSALTTINKCMKSLKRDGLKIPDIDNLDYDDFKIYKSIFHAGKTHCIFQFESDGMRKICEQTKPTSLEELSALNALYRPGALDSGLVDIYINRKNGKEEVTYDFPVLKQTLENTFGVLVYQEQIMNVFRVLANYSLGEADLIRRSMGKKKLEEMEKQRNIFLERAIKNGYLKDDLEKLWEKILNYSSYCFNKAHSMAYSAISYQTAFLKYYYPVYFWSTILTNECGDTDKFKQYLDLVKESFITILTPDINLSDLEFKVENNQKKTIRYGLIGIKGIGESAINAIIEERNKRPFASLYDFLSRISSTSVNKRALEALVKAGALDSLLSDLDPLTARSRLFVSLESMLSFMSDRKKQETKIDKKELKQKTLFDFLKNDTTIADKEREIEDNIIINVMPLDKLTLLGYEKEAIGLYINGHPVDLYKPFLSYVDIISVKDIKNRELVPYDFNKKNSKANRVKFVAVLVDVIFKFTKGTNQKFAVCTFEDHSDRIRSYIWNMSLLDISEDSLVEGNIFLVEGDIRQNKDFGDEKNIFVYNIKSIDDLIKKSYKGIIFSIPEEHVSEKEIADFYSLIENNPGECYIELESIKADGSKERVKIGDQYKISPNAKFINSVTGLFKFCNVYPIEG